MDMEQQASSCVGVAEADEKLMKVQSAISQFKMIKGH